MLHVAVFSAYFGRKLWSCLPCLAACLLCPWNNPLAAQSDTIAQTTSLRSLKEVVVQATRANGNSPVPHTNLTAEHILRQYHAQDMPYILSTVPSLVETSDGGIGTGYTSLRIRGSDPTRVNVTINGIPFNDAESQGVFWVDLPDLASSAAEIQVQRGVGTSTNGAGAFGASVNLNLAHVESEPIAAISNTLGSFGTRKHTFQLGTGLMGAGEKKLAFTGRYSNVHTDGFVDRARASLQAVHLSGAYLDNRQTVQAHFLSGHEITYQAWNGLPAQYLEIDSLRTFNTAGMEQPGSPYPNEVDDYTQRHVLLHYKRSFKSNVSLQLNGHYTQGFGYYEQYKADQDLADYGLPTHSPIDTVFPPLDLIRQRWLDNRFYGSTFALRWSSEMGWKPTFMLGGAWSRYQGEHFGKIIWAEDYTGASNEYRYYDNDAKKDDSNLFLKVEASPAQSLTLLLDMQLRSLRYSFLGFDNELNNIGQKVSLLFFNPKVGASYSLSKAWQAYVFLGAGNREPNRDDYTQSTPSSRPKPENLLDLETGVRHYGKDWTASANVFWMRYWNQLVLDGRINDVGAYIRTNVPDSWRAGLELEANGKVNNWWRVAANAAFSQNKIKEIIEYRDNWDNGLQEPISHRNTDLAFSPQLVARGECTLVWKQNQPSNAVRSSEISTSLIGKYVSAQFLDNTSSLQTSLPGYFVSDARVNFDLMRKVGKQLSLSLSLNNLLDTKYASNGWAYRYISAGFDPRPSDPYSRLEGNDVYHQAGFFPQAGRHWMATLRLVF